VQRSGAVGRSIIVNKATATLMTPVRAGVREYDRPVAVRIVVAEDSYLIRESLERLLAGYQELELVAVCEDLDSLREAVRAHQPDVLLTDIRMPPGGSDEGLQVAEELRDHGQATAVLVLSQYAEPRYALRLLGDGSEGRGYLLKERLSDADQLVGAIREVARGGSVVDPKIVDALLAARSAAERSPLNELTPREREVLAEMAQGKSNAAIAESLVVTERAIEKHINSILSKLGVAYEDNVNRRVKAVLIYLSEQS
jgi:DNA-binding NarL/FixJ family response regulator